MLTVVTWRWGTKYGREYVDRLKAGVARHLAQPHRFLCIGDEVPIPDTGLLRVRDGCYARLRMFDPDWQREHGIERLVCLDLDLVVVGPLDPLFNRPQPFVILHGGHFNPCPFNGSAMMIAAGARPEIWRDFDAAQAERVAMADGTWRGSDQTWIARKAPDAAGWTHRDGIYAFGKPGWPGGDALPADARIVAFPGAKDPATVRAGWIAEHWTG